MSIDGAAQAALDEEGMKCRQVLQWVPNWEPKRRLPSKNPFVHLFLEIGFQTSCLGRQAFEAGPSVPFLSSQTLCFGAPALLIFFQCFFLHPKLLFSFSRFLNEDSHAFFSSKQLFHCFFVFLHLFFEFANMPIFSSSAF